MTEYFLPPHVHFCCRGDALVFLDLKRDDYSLINGAEAVALRRVFLEQQQPGELDHEFFSAAEELMQNGLLTTDQHGGRCIAPARVEQSMKHLIDPEDVLEVRMTPRHVWDFIAACLIAA